ncbi:MAG: hypothetical protein ACT6UH_25825 [Hydrogenophaga sp.]|jgi:hypothetical protein|uniref:hypothetical protein n=1 Tax=Hydrogenophaga sp. TaxID=1904254 RepID=UPI004035E993
MVQRTRRAEQPSTPAAIKPARKTRKPQERSGVPGEHWWVLGAGIAAWALTRKSPSFLLRSAGLLAGSALVGRAASGRDGLSKVLRVTPLGGRVK